MSIHAIDLARSPNHRKPGDPARFGDYAVNIYTSSSCRSPNCREGQLHVPPPLAHANVLVYELISILLRRVLITLELVHTALRTRTVRDLRACACVSVRVRAVPTPLPAGLSRRCPRRSRGSTSCASLPAEVHAPCPPPGSESVGGSPCHAAAPAWLRGPRRPSPPSPP